MNLDTLLHQFDCNNGLSEIINAICKSSVEIEQLVNRVFLDKTVLISKCIQNSSGDEQHKMDILSNEIMISNLTNSNSCSVLISEENEDAIIVDESHSGNYIVYFDPLDGSSNIDCNCV